MASEKILVTDDEELIVQLCRRILTKKGYEVEIASTGTRALEICGEMPIDILLTDIKMPGMDGLELIEKARKNQPDIAAMVITGHGTIDTAIETLKLGVMGFLVKPFTPDTLLTSVQNVIERRHMIRENARLKSLMPLFEATKTLMSEVDLNRLLNLIVNYAVKETKAEEGSLLIVDGTGQLRSCVVTDFVPNMTGILENRVGERVARWIMEHRRPLLLRRNVPPNGQHRALGADVNFTDIFENSDLLSILSVPLMKKDRMIGVLNLSKLTDPTPFSEADQELITIQCGQAAVMIENARLFRELQQKTMDLEQANFEAIRALSQALEARDCGNRDHSDRLINYAIAVAEKLNLPADDIRKLKYAALLHDIGKIGVRDTVLKKPDKLQLEEYDEMKKHPLLGAQIVKQIKFLEDLVPVIYHHHERWDGKGYPDSLGGEKIPLCSRILAVIDAFDSMTSDRPYRKAMPFSEAIGELQRCSGSQFDPTVVEAFLEVLKGKTA